MRFLVGEEGKESLFLKDYFSAIFAYAAQRVPEISDQYYPVDDAYESRICLGFWSF